VEIGRYTWRWGEIDSAPLEIHSVCVEICMEMIRYMLSLKWGDTHGDEEIHLKMWRYAHCAEMRRYTWWWEEIDSAHLEIHKESVEISMEMRRYNYYVWRWGDTCGDGEREIVHLWR
jgi:hypothetical protein